MAFLSVSLLSPVDTGKASNGGSVRSMNLAERRPGEVPGREVGQVSPATRRGSKRVPRLPLDVSVL